MSTDNCHPTQTPDDIDLPALREKYRRRVIKEIAVDNLQFEMECTPGYYNNEGGGGGEEIRSHLGEPYGPGFYVFDDLLKEWREKSDLDGLVLAN